MMFKYVARVSNLKLHPFTCKIHSFARISDKSLKENIGSRVKVQGWVKSLRKMKELIFMDITDGSTNEYLQVIVKKSDAPKDVTHGSSVTVEGALALGPNKRLELHARDVNVHGSCDVTDGYPFLPKQNYSQDYARQYLHFRPRTKSFSSLLRLRDIASQAMHEHLRNRGFLNVHTPILTSNDCEGAGEVFSVKPESNDVLKGMSKVGVSLENSYFDTKVYLTVSGQLQLETIARALTKVYTFGPTFRAENSRSRLHLSEFYMLETEIAFVRDIEQIAREAEYLLKATVITMFDKGAEDLRCINAPDPKWADAKFGYITYDEAIDILNRNVDKLSYPIKYGDPLSKEHELFLVKYNDEIPIFLVNWPKHNKPFYMKECEDDSSKVAALDLLAPVVGEIVGGSIREDDYDKLKSKLPSPNLEWYLELRKYGNVTTGGFGLGFERFLQCVLGITNIKDTIPFPRWPHNCSL